MDIIACSPDMDVDRMYCTSTDEVIFAPGYETINEDAEAFIAYWHGAVLDEPLITDNKLESAWNEYFESCGNSLGICEKWETVEKFFREYDNATWMVYECTFYGMACGPTTTTVYYVVKADTVIEFDPDYEEEVEGNDPSEGKSEKEIEDEIIARQLRSLLG